MKILTDTQIKEADKYTIENEPISSIDLMERASNIIAQSISNNVKKESSLLFLIGKGNNGGDGLAVARILYHVGYNCSVYLPFEKNELSENCLLNLERLPSGIKRIDFDSIQNSMVIIDSLLGTGVKGNVTGTLSEIIQKVNELPNPVISIDMPSGMISEFNNKEQTIIKADVTFTLEYPKLAMLLPEAGEYCGCIEVLSIGLSNQYFKDTSTPYHYITKKLARNMILNRSKFAHKGTYGHALLICGSREMAGAAVLSTGAALRSGCGLVTVHIPAEERYSINTSYPSALTSLDEDISFSELPSNILKYSAIGIGCGLGQSPETVNALKQALVSAEKPMVIDADALNMVAEHYKLRYHIPANSILTPHLGELERLVGKWDNEEHKIELVRRIATNLKSILIVKGAHTMICLPDGDCYFNSTGNNGMAKGGSGDVLTGFITGLLARGYSSTDAAILGVYLHGVAGDKAAERYGMEGMNSQNMIEFLSFDL